MDSSSSKTISTVVGIDIETTGLIPAEAEIIEVAAIRYNFKTGQEIDRFEMLCSPKNPISSFVTTLTGISNTMVEGKPLFKEISDQFKAFVGDDIVFAHNASFDLGFLKYHGAAFKNPVWDTFKLAAAAWPSLPSYNLGSLSRFLELESKGEHRAAFDIEVTWLLLKKIEQALIASPATLGHIMHILGKTGQSHYAGLFSPHPIKGEGKEVSTLSSSEERVGGEVRDILGPNGLLQDKLLGFIFRTEQLAMAEEVEKLFAKKTIGLIEAGTGTGKTYAYSVPALLYISKQKRHLAPRGPKGFTGPVYISTHSRYLQDQLLTTDFPRLQQALGTSFKIVSLKGKNNYVCSARVTNLAEKGTYTPDEAWILIKTLLWLDKGGSGDLEELNLSHQPWFFIKRFSADADICRLRCKPSTCLYQKARKQAQEADIVIINHALLMQMSLTDTRFAAAPLIIDEAHHLPAIARKATMIDFSTDHMAELLHTLLECFSKLENDSNKEHLSTVSDEIESGYATLKAEISLFNAQHSPKRKLLLSPSLRAASAWKKVEQHGRDILQRLQFLKGLSQGLKHKLENDEAIMAEQAIVNLGHYTEHLERFLQGSPDRIQWLEKTLSKTEQAILGDMAQDITGRISSIFGTDRPVVLTSATLTTAQNFEYIKKTLGLLDCSNIQLPSSFIYRDHMLIYLVEDGPPPASPYFDTYTAEIIQKVSIFLQGKTLGLFTSKSAIKSVFMKANSSLYKENIKLLAQNMTGGRGTMVERFKKNERTVLLGTNSFWEGLDVPGEALSAVIIPKLPFTPPDDPVIQTMSRLPGVDAFQQVSLPEMLLRLRQGVGRLIRTSTDHGVILLLDSRLFTSSYREDVLKSFPPATIHIGKKDELLNVLGDWFSKK